MNVLVYSGPEVIQTSLNNVLSGFRSILLPHYSVQTISQQQLTAHPWSSTCALLVIPECRDLVLSSSATPIKSYVEGGGALLGLSAGAYYSDQAFDGRTFDAATNVPGHLVLQFVDKATGGYLCPNFYSGRSQNTARSVAIQLSDGERVDGIFQSGPREFVGVEEGKGIKVLARYVEGDTHGKIAALRYDLGTGKIILWAPNPEYPLTEEPASSTLSSPAWSPQEVERAEKKRCWFMRHILREFGLQLPSTTAQTPSHPLPQFLTCHFSKPAIISRITESLSAPSPGPQLSVFEDANDIFHFHALAESGYLLREARATSIATSLRPKHVIVCAAGELPDPKLTPLFDFTLYYDTLSAARSSEQCSDTADSWGFGEALIYGELVTSTQTMLDKNPQLLARLPVPFVSLASHQLAGRGRGNNVWLSPAGCLQFSILLRISLLSFPANKLVFVQYLFALAVVEACRDENVLGERGKDVRLKWPNDLYAIVETGGKEENKKVGGILVNTSFSSGMVNIVIGCGLNVLNPPPIASLSQLTQPYNEPPLRLERTAATIMAKFERMWTVFLEGRGSFDPFMDLYLERWLHSNQLVTVASVVPPKVVRIIGITPDHGLLRTIPERTGLSSDNEGFIDLQPDGNSFDLMAGMIQSKSST